MTNDKKIFLGKFEPDMLLGFDEIGFVELSSEELETVKNCVAWCLEDFREEGETKTCKEITKQLEALLTKLNSLSEGESK